MDVPGTGRQLDRLSVASLPDSITRIAGIAASWSGARLHLHDTLSMHSDDLTCSRDTHVTRKFSGKGAIFRKLSKAFQGHLWTKRNSLDCATEALAINHTNPVNVIQRCAACHKTRSTQNVPSRRVDVMTPIQANAIDWSPPEYGHRNFSCHLSPIALQHGHVRTELRLRFVSHLPLLVDIQNGQLFLYVDGSKRYCKRCSKTRRICIPYQLGFVDLPMYIDTSSVTLTYTPATDTLIIEGNTKGCQQLRPHPENTTTKQFSIGIRSV